MAKVDLHVHSEYSERPSEWILQRIGAAESYTDPQIIYKVAKERGMDFVTITDHNKIEGTLLLQSLYPDEIITGVESTVYFPEDSCKIHILVFGLNEVKFQEIQKIRSDIYQFQEYIKQENLAYSVAHATFSVNNKLNITQFEKLILMFDIFEGINGGRSFVNNDVLTRCLDSLTAEKISDLYSKYKLNSMSDDPWIKGRTGGSDDHAGLFIGNTYTVAEAKTVNEFLQKLKTKQTKPVGRHNDFKSLAFTVYKIVYDFSMKKSSNISNPIVSQFASNLFEIKPTKSIDNIKLFSFFNKRKLTGDPIKEKIYNLLEKVKKDKNTDLDDKFTFIYSGISDITDEIFLKFVKNIAERLEQGDLYSLMKEFGSILPSLFLSLPFFTTLKVMHQGKLLLSQIEESFLLENQKPSKVFWFTDTFSDLNGVSFTLQKIAQTSIVKNRNIQIVTCINDHEITKHFNLINLDSIYTFELPHYESYKISVPSLLRAVEQMSYLSPTSIYISTPGPIGLIGLLLSKLLNVPVKGVYHTDFTHQYEAIADDNISAKDMIEAFTKWFYESLDQILVPTNAYKQILLERGYNPAKFGFISKGIEKEIFHFNRNCNVLKSKYEVNGEINLLYTGRISKDKNITFLINLVTQYSAKSNPINLIIAGDGPDLETLKKTVEGYSNIYLLGEINRNDLAELYSECDLFVFPSKTDTFGMVVLEALACGLPCMVTDVGGPQELVIDNETGYICSTDNMNGWFKGIETVVNLKRNLLDEFIKWRESISEKTLNKYCWEKVIDEIN